jgi:hypothetical protein
VCHRQVLLQSLQLLSLELILIITVLWSVKKSLRRRPGMKPIAALFSSLLFVWPALAETPCDFKGISVGSRMSPAEIMLALGVSQYKTNPPRSFDQALVEKYGLMAAADIEEDNIGPFCNDTTCIVSHIGVGTANHIPVKATVSFHDGQVIEIVVSFGKTYWDEMGPILDEKYGADWKIERENTVVTDFETKKSHVLEGIFSQHVSFGTNRSTKDHCKIWASNVDMVFEHHDAFGPYHSELVIQLISKNF